MRTSVVRIHDEHQLLENAVVQAAREDDIALCVFRLDSVAVEVGGRRFVNEIELIDAFGLGRDAARALAQDALAMLAHKE